MSDENASRVELNINNENSVVPNDFVDGGKKKKTKTLIIKKFSYKKCLKVSAAILCFILLLFIGFLIFVITGDANAGLPLSSESYKITVQQSLMEKLSKSESGQVTLTPRRFSH